MYVFIDTYMCRCLLHIPAHRLVQTGRQACRKTYLPNKCLHTHTHTHTHTISPKAELQVSRLLQAEFKDCWEKLEMAGLELLFLR